MLLGGLGGVLFGLGGVGFFLLFFCFYLYITVTATNQVENTTHATATALRTASIQPPKPGLGRSSSTPLLRCSMPQQSSEVAMGSFVKQQPSTFTTRLTDQGTGASPPLRGWLLGEGQAPPKKEDSSVGCQSCLG